jgi:hypothetical protein
MVSTDTTFDLPEPSPSFWGAPAYSSSSSSSTESEIHFSAHPTSYPDLMISEIPFFSDLLYRQFLRELASLAPIESFVDLKTQIRLYQEFVWSIDASDAGLFNSVDVSADLLNLQNQLGSYVRETPFNSSVPFLRTNDVDLGVFKEKQRIIFDLVRYKAGLRMLVNYLKITNDIGRYPSDLVIRQMRMIISTCPCRQTISVRRDGDWTTEDLIALDDWRAGLRVLILFCIRLHATLAVHVNLSFEDQVLLEVIPHMRQIHGSEIFLDFNHDARKRMGETQGLREVLLDTFFGADSALLVAASRLGKTPEALGAELRTVVDSVPMFRLADSASEAFLKVGAKIKDFVAYLVETAHVLFPIIVGFLSMVRDRLVTSSMNVFLILVTGVADIFGVSALGYIPDRVFSKLFRWNAEHGGPEDLDVSLDGAKYVDSGTVQSATTEAAGTAGFVARKLATLFVANGLTLSFDLRRTLKDFDRVGKSVDAITRDLVDLLLRIFGGIIPGWASNFLSDSYGSIEVKEWFVAARRFLEADVASKLVLHSHLLRQLDDLIKLGEDHLLVSKKRGCEALNPLINSTIGLIRKLHDKVSPLLATCNGIRARPVTLVLYGEPGCGKSQLGIHAARYLAYLEASVDSERLEAYQAYFRNEVYIHGADKFNDGMTSAQSVGWFDDWGKDATIRGQENSYSGLFIHMNNDISFAPRMADVGMKNNIYVSLRYNIYSTNLTRLNDESVIDNNAVGRRIDFLVKPVLRRTRNIGRQFDPEAYDLQLARYKPDTRAFELTGEVITPRELLRRMIQKREEYEDYYRDSLQLGSQVFGDVNVPTRAEAIATLQEEARVAARRALVASPEFFPAVPVRDGSVIDHMIAEMQLPGNDVEALENFRYSPTSDDARSEAVLSDDAPTVDIYQEMFGEAQGFSITRTPYDRQRRQHLLNAQRFALDFKDSQYRLLNDSERMDDLDGVAIAMAARQLEAVGATPIQVWDRAFPGIYSEVTRDRLLKEVTLPDLKASELYILLMRLPPHFFTMERTICPADLLGLTLEKFNEAYSTAYSKVGMILCKVGEFFKNPLVKGFVHGFFDTLAAACGFAILATSANMIYQKVTGKTRNKQPVATQSPEGPWSTVNTRRSRMESKKTSQAIQRLRAAKFAQREGEVQGARELRSAQPTAIADVTGVIRRNMFEVWTYNDRQVLSHMGYGLGLFDRVFAMPAHLILHPVNDLMSEHNLRPDQVPLEFRYHDHTDKLSFKDIEPIAYDETDEQDWSFWTVDVTRQFRDITNLFISHDDCQSTLFSATRSIKGALVFPADFRTFEAAYAADVLCHDVGVWRRGVVGYGMATFGGDCGAPLLITHGRFAGKILGMHIAGGGRYQGNAGYSNLISSTLIEETCKELKRFPERFPLDIEIPDIDVRPQRSEVEAKRDYHGEVEANYVSRLVVPPSGVHQKNEIVRWYGAGPAYFEPLTCASRVSPQIFEENRARFGSVTVDPEALQLLKDIAPLQTEFYLKHAPNVVMRKIPMGEVLRGCRDMHLDGLPNDTSPGYPDTEFGVIRKDYWRISETGAISLGPEWPHLLRETELYANCLASGDIPLYLHKDVEKGERLAIRKVEDGKVRFINAPPTSIHILFVMYFGSAIDVLMTGAPFNSILKGLDEKNAAHWHGVAQFLRSKSGGKYVGSGDYAGFDHHQHPDVIRIAMQVMADMYPKEDLVGGRIRAGLIETLCRTFHIFGSVIEWYLCGMPSGCRVTTEINCITNRLLFVAAWCYLHGGDPKHALTFDRHVAAGFQGDDNIFEVDEEYSTQFTEEAVRIFVAKLGHDYTAADKGPARRVLQPLTESVVLKRGFRREPKIARWVGPLDLNVVLEIPLWTRAGQLREEIAVSNMRTAISELSLHGKEVYDEWMPKMKKFAGHFWKMPIEEWAYVFRETTKT